MGLRWSWETKWPQNDVIFHNHEIIMSCNLAIAIKVITCTLWYTLLQNILGKLIWFYEFNSQHVVKVVIQRLESLLGPNVSWVTVDLDIFKSYSTLLRSEWLNRIQPVWCNWYWVDWGWFKCYHAKSYFLVGTGMFSLVIHY